MAMAVALLSACSSGVRVPAPVEDRTGMGRSSSSTQATPAAELAKPMPGSENAGKPGYYTVQRGDTLYSISRRTYVSVDVIMRINNITNANRIYVGQVLLIPTYSS